MKHKQKPIYFCVLTGLRGCYMPDSVAHYGVRGFAHFADICRDHVREFRSLRAIRYAWEHVKAGRSLEICIAHAYKDEGGKAYGVTVGTSDARSLLEYRRACAKGLA